MWKPLALAACLLPAIAWAQSPPAATQEACGFRLGAAIHAKWRTESAAGFLGCPLNSEGEATASLQGTTGRWALFANGPAMQGGVLVLHTSGPSAGTVFMVRGCVGAVYQAMGGTGGIFGFPTREAYDVPGGVRGEFEGGYIAFNAATGLCTPNPAPRAR
jgi:uncharacterized protein with LGFP repeats